MRREGQAAEQAVEEHVRNIAAFPLAIPLMAGPGAITAIRVSDVQCDVGGRVVCGVFAAFETDCVVKLPQLSLPERLRFGKRAGSSGAPATAGATTADQKNKTENRRPRGWVLDDHNSAPRAHGKSSARA